MNHVLFKTALFGYSKESVCEYISELSEEFSQKLVDALAEQEKVQKELRERIRQLEQENESYKNQQFDLAGVMTDAAVFATGLRRKAEAENQEFCRQNEKKAAAEEQRILAYRAQINNIREEIRQLLNAFDAEIAAMDESLKELQTEQFRSSDWNRECVK